MIVDLHVHPFCKEATVTPSLGEAVQRMFFGASPDRKSLEDYTAMGKAFFHDRSLADIIRSKILGENAMALLDLEPAPGLEKEKNEA